MHDFDESAHGREVALDLGQAFRIRLHENPTTGYRWTLESSGEPVCALIDQTFEPAAGPPGQGGSHLWRFQTIRAGAGSIELVYRRSWEAAASPARRFTLRVQVLH